MLFSVYHAVRFIFYNTFSIYVCFSQTFSSNGLCHACTFYVYVSVTVLSISFEHSMCHHWLSCFLFNVLTNCKDGAYVFLRLLFFRVRFKEKKKPKCHGFNAFFGLVQNISKQLFCATLYR